MQACAAGCAVTFVTTLKLQLASSTVVGLTATKFKPLTLMCLASPSKYHVYLDLNGLGLLLPVSCII
jgi:hypothetical protein